MRRVLLVMAMLLAVLPAQAARRTTGAKDASKATTRPTVVVFDTERGEGVDKALAASATRALCSYLHDTQRVDAIIFNRESPTVLRAIMDKQLTADQVASYSSQTERIGVVKALSYDYAAGAQVSVKNDQMQVKLWVAKSDGDKKSMWETTTSATIGTGTNSFENAMQSATSGAVISISRLAFVDLPIILEGAPTTGAETTAIKPDLTTPPAAPGALDYASQADSSLQAGEVAVAIQQYQQAINADPSNASLRMKLVDAYIRKGMYNEARAELDRAESYGAKPEQTDPIRKQIDAAQMGQGRTRPTSAQPASQPPKADTTPTAPQPPKAVTPTQAAQSRSAVAMMIAGDKLWHDGKPDEAADAYKQATALDSSDWRTYERLALVDASVAMFTDSRLALAQLAKLQPDPPAQTVAKRYSLFSTIFTQQFGSLFKQYDDDLASYSKRQMTRESYYSSIKGMIGRLESMANFIDALQVPPDKKTANLHRSLACGLVSQAASSLRDYLETNNKDQKTSAETFVAQAKKELDIVKSLEATAAASKPSSRTASSGASAANAAANPPAAGNQGADTSAQAQPDAASANAAPPMTPDSSQDAPPPMPDPGQPDANAQGQPQPDGGPGMQQQMPLPPGSSGPPIVPPDTQIL